MAPQRGAGLRLGCHIKAMNIGFWRGFAEGGNRGCFGPLRVLTGPSPALELCPQKMDLASERVLWLNVTAQTAPRKPPLCVA